MKTWKKHQTPDLTVCPQSFCFFWNEAGDQVAPGFYPNPEAALANMVTVEKSGCGFRYGLCRRACSLDGVDSSPTVETKDFYEPCEPFLRKAGLPDFFFDDPGKIKTEEGKAEYWAYFGVEK